MSASPIQIAVFDFHGTLCERDCVAAFAFVNLCAPFLVAAEEATLPRAVDGIVVPGGFSYGDYIRPGAMARTAAITRVLREEAEKGTPIIGICNGFQILCEIGLLPGILLKNRDGRFICREVGLHVASRRSPFLRAVEPDVLHIPIAHKYGQYYVGQERLAALQANDQIALQYTDANPNGSVCAIAGVTNEAGNVLGMMPHPERRSLPWATGQDGGLMWRSWAACLGERTDAERSGMADSPR